MPAFKTMDPDVVRELLDGHEDILSPEAEKEANLYKQTQCPMCGQQDCEKRLHPPKIEMGEDGTPNVIQSPFGNSILPEGYAHCIHCDTDFNPHTGMVFKTAASMIHGPE